MANNTIVKDQNTESVGLLTLGGTVEKVNGTVASAASAVIDATDWQIVRLTPSADCHIVVGANPTATTAGMRMWANSVESFWVRPGHKIAVLGAILDVTTQG